MKTIPVILFLSIALMISSAEAKNGKAAEVSAICVKSASDCCWVVKIWQKMGRSHPGITIHNKYIPECCDMPGVTCEKFKPIFTFRSRQRKVLKIEWGDQSLRGPIPSEIKNLKNLQVL
jgi:hypothetical protein